MPKEAQLPTQSLSKEPVRSPYSKAVRAAASMADAILRPAPVPQVVPFTKEVDFFQRHPQVKGYWAYFERQTYRGDYDLGLGMISGNTWVERDFCSDCARWFATLQSLVRPGKPEKEGHSLCVLSMSDVSSYPSAQGQRCRVLISLRYAIFYILAGRYVCSEFLCWLLAKLYSEQCKGAFIILPNTTLTSGKGHFLSTRVEYTVSPVFVDRAACLSAVFAQ